MALQGTAAREWRVLGVPRSYLRRAWPLRLAVQHGYTNICKRLLEHGAQLEPPIRASSTGEEDATRDALASVHGDIHSPYETLTDH